MKEIFRPQSIALHQLGRARIEESEAASGDKPGHVSEQPFIKDLRLGEIGDLCRSTNVGGSWEDVVLDDRAKESVRRQLLRALRKLVGRIAQVTNRNAFSFFEEKEQRCP